MADPAVQVLNHDKTLTENVANQASTATTQPLKVEAVTPPSSQPVNATPAANIPDALMPVPDAKPQEDSPKYEDIGLSPIEIFVNNLRGLGIRITESKKFLDVKGRMIGKKAAKSNSTVITKDGKYGS